MTEPRFGSTSVELAVGDIAAQEGFDAVDHLRAPAADPARDPLSRPRLRDRRAIGRAAGLLLPPGAGAREDRGLGSVAFPAISTGAFGYPLEAAARIALEAVTERAPALRSVERIRFVLYDEAALAVHARVLEEIAAGAD